MIDQFLDVVYGEASGRTSVWWRQKPGAKSPIDRQKWFSWPDQKAEVIEFINGKAALDVYVPVALYDEAAVQAAIEAKANGEKGPKAQIRRPENTTVVSSLWQDTDTFDPKGYRIEPSIIVHTSEGRTHCWWTLDKPYPAEQAELVVKKITYAHRAEGADVSSWGRNKVLRVPGTYNSSHGFPEEVTAEYTGNVYTLEEIANAYDDVALPTGPAVKMRTKGDGTPPEINFSSDNLPNFMDVQAKLPADFPLDLITREPGENRSEMRWKLIAELIEAGLTDEETFVIAWRAKCSDKWREDPRGENGLWAEIAKERQKYEWGAGDAESPAEPSTPVKHKKGREVVEILSAADRQRAKAFFKRTFIHEYEEWVRGNVKIFNAPYHRASAWMVLSQLVGETARLNIGGRDVPLGFYFFILGGTTTGKSQAKSYMRRAVHKGYHGEKNPDLGDDVSIAALLDSLRDRPDGVALMSSDEVDGMLNKMKERGSWRSEDMSKYTDLYDGDVPPLIRKGQIDGTWTKCQFSIYGMGTEIKVVDALDRTMFESGFLARFQWFIGDTVDVPEEDLGVRFGGQQDYLTQYAVIEEWKHRLGKKYEDWFGQRATARGEIPIIEPDSPETEAFFTKVTAKMEKRLFAGDPNADILRPSISRTAIAAAKMAALLAIADGRFAFSKDDLLVALWHCEELLGNLYHVAQQVASSDHAKQLDALYDYALAHGPDVKSDRVFKAMSDRYGLDVLTVERYRDELRAQGRVTFVPTGAKHSWVINAIEPKGE